MVVVVSIVSAGGGCVGLEDVLFSIARHGGIPAHPCSWCLREHGQRAETLGDQKFRVIPMLSL